MGATVAAVASFCVKEVGDGAERVVVGAGGRGRGWVVYWLMENVPALAELEPRRKRYVALALAAVFPVLAWLAMLAMGYESSPGGWQAWVERIFLLVAGAGGLVVSQGLHGARHLEAEGGG